MKMHHCWVAIEMVPLVETQLRATMRPSGLGMRKSKGFPGGRDLRYAHVHAVWGRV